MFIYSKTWFPYTLNAWNKLKELGFISKNEKFYAEDAKAGNIIKFEFNSSILVTSSSADLSGYTEIELVNDQFQFKNVENKQVKYKVSINCWDSLTGEFMGGKEFFETEEEARKYFNSMVIDYLDEDVEIFLTENNKILSELRTFERD